jgi:hypothetical protein
MSDYPVGPVEETVFPPSLTDHLSPKEEVSKFLIGVFTHDRVKGSELARLFVDEMINDLSTIRLLSSENFRGLGIVLGDQIRITSALQCL